MRQYWLPALKSEELIADGDPVRFMLLGEKLIAFRDSSGRIGHFMFPCWVMPPIERIELNVRARAYVPLDNTHSLVMMVKKPAPANLRAERAGRFAGATQNYNEYPNATDWHGRYRRIDSYSAIDGVQLQDQALQESMGAIADRTFEHLAPSDIMISHVRRALIKAAKAYKKDGALPVGQSRRAAYSGVRAGHFEAPADKDWLVTYRDKLAVSPVEAAMPMVAE